MRCPDKTEMRKEAYSAVVLHDSLVFKIYQQDFDIQIFGKASYNTNNVLLETTG